MTLTSTQKKIALSAGVLLGAMVAYLMLAPRQRRRYPAAESLVLPHPELMQPERFVPLAGGFNFRDAGGYRTHTGRRVRLGKLYRAGSLAQLAEADLEQVAGLGLKLIADLRTPKEAAREPDRLPEAARAAYRNLPAYEQTKYSDWLRTALFRRHQLDKVIAEGYLRLVDAHALELGRVLKLLAEPDNLPALVHCTAGKDRTGMVVALLHAVLGVPDEAILADYAYSNREFAAICHITQSDIRRMQSVGITDNEIEVVMSANPDNVRTALAHIRERYGSVEAYLQNAAGVSAAELQQLHDNFLV